MTEVSHECWGAREACSTPTHSAAGFATTAHAVYSVSFGQILERAVTEQHRVIQRERCQVIINTQRARCNARISTIIGAQSSSRRPGGKEGDRPPPPLSTGTATTLSCHPNTTRTRGFSSTSPWSALCFQGRRTCQRKLSIITSIKLFRKRPFAPQVPYEDDFGHLVWSADSGLVDDTAMAVPFYRLADRCFLRIPWPLQDGVQSSCLTEDEVSDSFSPLQLNLLDA